jgi:hypothetical protein
MDERRFDALAKSLGTAAPRRTLLKAIGAAVVGGAVALSGRTGTNAAPLGHWCASGFRPCKGGAQTACCSPSEYCCNRKSGNPTCTSSKATCLP